MAVFAYENGKLVPAQPVDLSMSRLGEGALAALRERAVELIEAPLFPVGWVGEPVPGGTRESLIALDPSGQIVTVDVLARLSADELIAALAATGRHADNSSERLATLYGPGADAFAADWRAFLDACPPSSSPGPRLFLIVLGIEEEVRPAVDALSGAGVDVRVASVIGSGTQVLISLEQVRPRITALSSLLGVARRRVSLESGRRQETWEADVQAPTNDTPTPEAHPANHTTREEPELPTNNTPEHRPDHGASDNHHVEIHAQAATDTPRPAPRHARRGASGVRSARFGAQPATPLPESPEALAAFNIPAEDAEAPRRRRSRLRDMLAAQTPTAQPEPASTAQVDASQQTLSTFDITTRPPVAARAEEPEIPTVGAPESAATADTAIAAAAPTLPVHPERRHHAPEPATRRSETPNNTGAEMMHTVRKPRRRHAIAPQNREAAPAPRPDTREEASTYAQSLAAQRRAEQILWDEAAPQHAETTPRTISESSAATSSANAVADAAERDYLSPAGRLMAIAQRNATPIDLHWISRRRDINLRAQVTSWGTIVCSNGAAYSDPTQAAREQSGITSVDGWKVWKADDGRSLGEL